LWATRMVTVSSAAIVSQALISGAADPSGIQGVALTGLASARNDGSQNPSTMAPPTAAELARKARRFRLAAVIGALPSRLTGQLISWRRRGGWRRECEDRCRSGRCWSSRHRYPRRSDWAAAAVAPRRP